MRGFAQRVYGQPMRFDRIVWRDLRAHRWDYALTGAMVAIALLALATRIDVQSADAHLFRPDTWVGWVVTIAVCATLVGRRRWPMETLALGLVLLLPIEFSHQRDTVAFFAVVITLYSVAAYLPLRFALRGVALMAAFYVVLLATGTILLTSVPLIGLLFLTVAFAFGLAVQHSRRSEHRESEIAIGRATAAIEIAEMEAANERLRMAQELHDVVAHSLSVIAVQAGIGAHLMNRLPAEAARSLLAIRSTCDSTGIELGRLVAILRNGTATDSTAAPTIATISTLVEQIRCTDLAVTLNINGDLGAVPAGASLAAYRIVQEALTNIVRHAGSPVHAAVTIEAMDDHIFLAVVDDGRGLTVTDAIAHSGGNGLIGMRERAQMYGGDVQAGPRPGGGFRVRATLDTRAESVAIQPTLPMANPVIDDGPRHDRRRLSPSAWDTALAMIMAVISIVEAAASHPSTAGPHFTPTDAWAISLRLGCAAMLAFRRRYPTASYAVAWVLGLALSIGDYQVGVITLILWIALYSVAAHATSRRVVAAILGTLLGIAMIAASKPPDLSVSGAVWASVFFFASAVLGEVMRRDRGRRATELNERRNDAAARTRHSRLVLTNERLRIADELGTILTRSIDAIALYAEAGSHHVDGDTDAARDALQSISTISRDALNDLRRLLKHLRTASDATNYTPISSADSVHTIDSNDSVGSVDGTAAGVAR